MPVRAEEEAVADEGGGGEAHFAVEGRVGVEQLELVPGAEDVGLAVFVEAEDPVAHGPSGSRSLSGFGYSPRESVTVIRSLIVMVVVTPAFTSTAVAPSAALPIVIPPPVDRVKVLFESTVTAVPDERLIAPPDASSRLAGPEPPGFEVTIGVVRAVLMTTWA